MKLLKTVITAIVTAVLLTGGYLGYEHGFRIGMQYFQSTTPLVGIRPDPANLRKAKLLAIEALGEDHWASSSDDNQIRYYDSRGGYWIYGKTYERQSFEDRERWILAPFVLIVEESDEFGFHILRTLTSERATIDFASGRSNPGSMEVISAQVLDRVLIRDNKGTPNDLQDDLVIGPLQKVDYLEANRQIHSEDAIRIVDRNFVVTAVGLTIDLWGPKEAKPSSGVGLSNNAGPKRAIAHSQVAIHLIDGGSSSGLPGLAPPGGTGTQLARADQEQNSEPVPVDLFSDGPMQIDFPKPMQMAKGEPAPPESKITHVSFDRNVIVKRGKPEDGQDELRADHLALQFEGRDESPNEEDRDSISSPDPFTGSDSPTGQTLVANREQDTSVNSESAQQRKIVTTDPGTYGPLDDVQLRFADATGHAVWLESQQQGLQAMGNRLTYEAFSEKDGRPDRIDFQSHPGQPLSIRQIETDAVGQVQRVTHIRQDGTLTIFNDAPDRKSGTMSPGTIIAKGAGELESRPSLEAEIAQRAGWSQGLHSEDLEGGQLRKVTLTGHPWLDDREQGRWSADDSTIAWLRKTSRPKLVRSDDREEPTSDTDLLGSPDPIQTSDPRMVVETVYRVEHVQANRNVKFVSDHQTLFAHDRLDVAIETIEQELDMDSLSSGQGDAIDVASDLAGSGRSPTRSDEQMGSGQGGRRSTINLSASQRSDQSGSTSLTSSDAVSQTGPPDSLRAKQDLEAQRIDVKLTHEPATGESHLVRALLRDGVKFQQTPPALPLVKSDESSGMTGEDSEVDGAIGADESELPEAILVLGEAVDVKAIGEDIYEVVVAGINPDGGPEDAQRRSRSRRNAAVASLNPQADRSLVPARPDNADVPATWASVVLEGVEFHGEVLGVNQARDLVWNNGPGRLISWERPGASLFSENRLDLQARGQRPTATTDQLGHRTAADSPSGVATSRTRQDDKTTEALKPTVLDWQGWLMFVGRTAPIASSIEPGPARVVVDRDVWIRSSVSGATCQRLTAWFDQAIALDGMDQTRMLGQVDPGNFGSEPGLTRSLNRPQPTDRLRVENRTRATNESETPSPPQITRVICQDHVILVNQKLDEDDPSLLIEKQVLRGNQVEYDRPSDRFRIPREGQVYLYSRSDPRSGVGDPSSAGLSPHSLARIRFTEGMEGLLGQGGQNGPRNAPLGYRRAEFQGDVELLHAQVNNAFVDLNSDNLPPDGIRLTTQTLAVEEFGAVRGSSGGEPRRLATARGRVVGQSARETLQADQVHYDFSKSLMHAIAEPGRYVTLTLQEAPGRKADRLVTEAIRFDRRTGKAEPINPRTVQIGRVSGTRLAPAVSLNRSPNSPASPRTTPASSPRFNPTPRDLRGVGRGR